MAEVDGYAAPGEEREKFPAVRFQPDVRVVPAAEAVLFVPGQTDVDDGSEALEDRFETF